MRAGLTVETKASGSFTEEYLHGDASDVGDLSVTFKSSLYLYLFVADDSSSESDCESDGDGSSCSSSSDSEVFDVIAEIKRKKAHPDRLHEELWYNDPGQVRRNQLAPSSDQ